MTRDEDLSRVLLARLPEARVSVGLSAPVTEYSDYDDRAVAAWHGEVDLHVDPEDVDDPAEVQAWARPDAALSRQDVVGGGATQRLVVATARGLVLDLDAHPDVRLALDESADYAHFMPLFERPGAYGVNEEFDELIDGAGNRVVLLDRALLAPAWRGLGGVGRLLTARMLRWLMSDALLAITQPAPFEIDGGAADPAYRTALQQVRGVWSSLGFSHWRDDIWYLDPALVAFDDAVAALEDRLGLRRD
ncbi:hypothetical protein QOZ88_23005 [Blastococcus sp. BMG 814]|uniref:N-acetyltransferase domain-containing protein n=1 Tax=Blastococcus carthaginiensis TaxID=3050034 RepID=A0ABT9IIW3_9ACTN|nr:hypothetical protein [Blastococcus carthaginiensis]MDP5185512.1 hypothetical protein [Blastococcus carthaginiensis]